MKKNNNSGEIIIYEGADGAPNIEVRFGGETAWLTIEQMAELFGESRSTINEHILNIYAEKELQEAVSIRKIGNSDFSTKPKLFIIAQIVIKNLWA